MKIQTRELQDTANAADALAIARRVVSSSRHRDDAFLVFDESAVRSRVAEIVDGGLRGIARPYFDVFCNCEPRVLSLLAGLGFGFRARTKEEVRMAAATGVSPARILLDSAMLVASHVRHAAAAGVTTFTVRSASDLAKIKKACPGARYGIRICSILQIPRHSFLIYTLLSSVLIKLQTPLADASRNHGIYDSAFELHRQVSDSGLRLAGLAFERDDYDEAVDYRKQVALAKLLVDVAAKQFDQVVSQVHLGSVGSAEEVGDIADHFAAIGLDAGVELLVGVSRPIVSSSTVLCVKVVGEQETDSGIMKSLVVSDGIYGHFGRLLHRDEMAPAPYMLFSDNDDAFYCDILGPSGDPLDVVGLSLPVSGATEVGVGDWLVFPDMGDEVLTPANSAAVEAASEWEADDIRLENVQLEIVRERNRIICRVLVAKKSDEEALDCATPTSLHPTCNAATAADLYNCAAGDFFVAAEVDPIARIH